MMKERNNQIWKSICAVTYSDYESASLRDEKSTNEIEVEPCNLYTMANLFPVLKCSMKMLLYIICPYLLLGFLYFYLTSIYIFYTTSPVIENYWLPRESWQQFKLLSYQLVAYLTCSVAIVSHLYIYPATSPKGKNYSSLSISFSLTRIHMFSFSISVDLTYLFTSYRWE